MTTQTFTKITILMLLAFVTVSCGKIRADVDPDTQDFLDINDYLFSQNIEATLHPEGVYFVLNERGSGLSPVPGDSVVVDYSIYYLNGRLIDTTNEGIARENGIFSPNHPYRPFILTLGQGQVIRGFEIGAEMLSENGSGTFYVPSRLGFTGWGTPLRTANLIIELELHEVRH